MNIKLGVFISSIATLSACANLPQEKPVVHITVATFDKSTTEKLVAEGKNTIKGSALIRQQGGGVVTCAGQKIMLTPATEYSSERISTIYGNKERGFISARTPPIYFQPNVPEYFELSRTTICDAQGYFKFEKVADGDFFVTGAIIWMVGYSKSGGNLMQRVSVSKGELKEIVLSP